MTATRDRVESQPPPPDERCGSYAGWNAHRHTGTPPCRPCKDAHNKYVREWRRRGGGPSPERATTDPARGTSVPPAGKGLTAGGSPAPRGLTPTQVATLGRALADAIAWREPSGFCADCEDEDCAGLCQPHSGDLDLADEYLALARELGIELEDA